MKKPNVDLNKYALILYRFAPVAIGLLILLLLSSFVKACFTLSIEMVYLSAIIAIIVIVSLFDNFIISWRGSKVEAHRGSLQVEPVLTDDDSAAIEEDVAIDDRINLEQQASARSIPLPELKRLALGNTYASMKNFTKSMLAYPEDSSDEISNKPVIFDAYIATDVECFVYVIRAGTNTTLPITLFEKLYLLLTRVNQYKMAHTRNSIYMILLIANETDDASQSKNFIEAIKEAFKPAIRSNLLKIDQVKVSREV